MWQSYKDDDRAMHCFLALGLKPRLPMSRWAKAKAFLFGLFVKLTFYRDA